MKRIEKKGLLKQADDILTSVLPELDKKIRLIASGTAVAVVKGRNLVPEADFALALNREAVPGLDYATVELSREDALRFLSKDNLVLPDAPSGYILLTYKGLGLGFVKNLGKRTNSLLPNSRRIRRGLES